MPRAGRQHSTGPCPRPSEHRPLRTASSTLQSIHVHSDSSSILSEVKVKSLSRVRRFATPWTVAYHAPPAKGFSRQEYWSGVPFPSLNRLVVIFRGTCKHKPSIFPLASPSKKSGIWNKKIAGTRSQQDCPDLSPNPPSKEKSMAPHSSTLA